MKKIMTFILILFLCGCTVVRINTNEIDTIVNVVLSKNNTLYNRVGKGYKYYVPRGVTYIDTDSLNDKLYSNGVYYYLYIDAVSYYNKRKIDYKENKNAYYSKKISVDDGFEYDGYLEINKQDNLYYIEFVYNYARIEAMVTAQNLNSSVLNATYILSTIQFNYDVIELMLNDEYFTNKEEKYTVFTPREESENFELKYEDSE